MAATLNTLSSETTDAIASFSKTMRGYVEKIATGLVAGESGYRTAAEYIVKLRKACTIEDEDGNKVPDLGGRSPRYRAGWLAAVEMAFGETTKADRSRISDATRYHVRNILVEDGSIEDTSGERASATPTEKLNRAVRKALPTHKVEREDEEGNKVKVEVVNETAAVSVTEQVRTAGSLLVSALTRIEDGSEVADVGELVKAFNPVLKAAKALQPIVKALAEEAIAAEPQAAADAS